MADKWHKCINSDNDRATASFKKRCKRRSRKPGSYPSWSWS